MPYASIAATLLLCNNDPSVSNLKLKQKAEGSHAEDVNEGNEEGDDDDAVDEEDEGGGSLLEEEVELPFSTSSSSFSIPYLIAYNAFGVALSLMSTPSASPPFDCILCSVMSEYGM